MKTKAEFIAERVFNAMEQWILQGGFTKDMLTTEIAEALALHGYDPAPKTKRVAVVSPFGGGRGFGKTEAAVQEIASRDKKQYLLEELGIDHKRYNEIAGYERRKSQRWPGLVMIRDIGVGPLYYDDDSGLWLPAWKKRKCSCHDRTCQYCRFGTFHLVTMPRSFSKK